jgi:hypothetical protein
VNIQVFLVPRPLFAGTKAPVRNKLEADYNSVCISLLFPHPDGGLAHTHIIESCVTIPARKLLIFRGSDQWALNILRRRKGTRPQEKKITYSEVLLGKNFLFDLFSIIALFLRLRLLRFAAI